MSLSFAAGLCVAFCSLAETTVTAQSVAAEVRTFRLQYASAEGIGVEHDGRARRLRGS